MWLRECCKQVEAEVISNSRNKLHQTTYKDFFSALYKYLSDSQAVTQIDRLALYVRRRRAEGTRYRTGAPPA